MYKARAIASLGAGLFGAIGCWAASQTGSGSAVGVVAICTLFVFIVIWAD